MVSLAPIASSARFKEEIKPMDKASEAILALKPVTFRYKQELDPDGIPQFGLIAEEVEKVNPDLVVRDEDGKIYTVRYEAVNAMLLNEFLKEHRKVRGTTGDYRAIGSESRASSRTSTDTQQQKQIEALAAGLQKVSAARRTEQTSTDSSRAGLHPANGGPMNCITGAYGARTRNLCRDRAAL